jgi:small-conductance mechanosensitive channel
MDAAQLDWWTGNAWVRAAVIFAVFVVIAGAFDRWFAARGRRLATRVLRGDISQQTDTRLRFVRRLIWLFLLVVGTLSALSQFTGLGRVAGSFLASGALVAAIVGFAARTTLANLIAGIMLALTQPLRVGDWVTFEEHYGVVEDVRLNFTLLRALGDQRIVIPNERLVSGILRNDTLETGVVGLDVSIWLPAGTDVPRAVDVLRDTGLAVTIAETAAEGTRLAVGDERVPPGERAKREAELREQCFRRLRDEDLVTP